MPNEFLGTGWNLPIATDAQGQIQMVDEAETVRQSIWTILSTAPGERVMRPDFGCGIHDLVFAVNTADTAGRVASQVHQALLHWEPRIDALEVEVVPDPGQPNLLQIEISYQIRSNNNRFNLVYPFYLEP